MRRLIPRAKKSGLTRARSRTRLDGATWLRYSISVWNDIKKSREEEELGHPAIYPASLVQRLLACYFFEDWGIVLDPFLGSGSTLVAAQEAGLSGIGLEVVPEIAHMAFRRLRSRMPLTLHAEGAPAFLEYEIELVEEPEGRLSLPQSRRFLIVVRADARRIRELLPPESVDIVITSPPYWTIHTRERSVDRKPSRPYSGRPDDLGNIENYGLFLDALTEVFRGVYEALKPGSFCIVNVMDLRYGSTFIPYHADLIFRLTAIGLSLEDIIIWDRRHEYNNLRPIGYPYRFIANKVHEYLLIFRKAEAE